MSEFIHNNLEIICFSIFPGGFILYITVGEIANYFWQKKHFKKNENL